MSEKSDFWRKINASWRDTRLLLMQFRWPLLSFSIAVIGGGLAYYQLARLAGEPPNNPIEAIYQVLSLTFLNPLEAFPRAWYLELFYFIMPVIGIGILAQGFADFGVLFFNRRARSKEWEMAVASTYHGHIVVVGLGHLGYRVITQLTQLDQDVVAIEMNPSADLFASAQHLGVPVIQDDGMRQSTLEAAGVRKARTLVLCTQNDSLNLQMALKARSLNPKIDVVLRIFDDDFAHALQDQFGFHAMSATSMAAPAFAAAAAGMDVTRPITVEGESFSLARLHISPQSRLQGLKVGEVEKRFEISIVLLRRDGASDFHPSADRQLVSGDVIAILGAPDEMLAFIQSNRSAY